MSSLKVLLLIVLSGPIYAVSVSEISLKNGPIFASRSLPKPLLDYYISTTDLNKKVLIKLEELGSLERFINKKKLDKPYYLLYKKDGSFNLEALTLIPINYKDALPVIKDFSSYNDWALKDINIKRDGEKSSYLIDVNSLNYIKNSNSFDTRVSMNKIFKGSYKMELIIDDMTADPKDPRLSLRMKEPSKLAKEVYGTFYFLDVPQQPYLFVYFFGKAETNWALYNLLPLPVVRTQVMERVYTLMENIEYRIKSLKKN